MRQKAFEVFIRLLFARYLSVLGLIAIVSSPLAYASTTTAGVESGFPASFVNLYIEQYGSFKDTGGKGEGQTIGGFGGLRGKSRAENQAAREHVPVILLHGNGVHALHTEGLQGGLPVPTLGVWPIRDFLVNKLNYNDAEIWAISYLGSSPAPRAAELGPVVQVNLPDIRKFIDTVIEYLDVNKVDIIAHSLGNNMAKGYMNGFQSDNSWDNSDHRFDKISTYVSLAGAHYGLPSVYFLSSDTDMGSVFEEGAHEFNGVVDNTPYGALRDKQVSDNNAWKKQTSLDEETVGVNAPKTCYIAIRSKADFVDGQVDDSSRLVGAHLNHEFDFTKHGQLDLLNLIEHSRVLTEESVFDSYASYLDGKCFDESR
jgi:hypothetical protein